jgi:protein TonB
MTGSDYPPYERINGYEGTVAYRLTIGRDGRPVSCKVTKSSGWDKMDFHTCTLLMRRARFCPATDKSGAPTTGTYSAKVTWLNPVGPAPPSLD